MNIQLCSNRSLALCLQYALTHYFIFKINSNFEGFSCISEGLNVNNLPIKYHWSFNSRTALLEVWTNLRNAILVTLQMGKTTKWVTSINEWWILGYYTYSSLSCTRLNIHSTCTAAIKHCNYQLCLEEQRSQWMIRVNNMVYTVDRM